MRFAERLADEMTQLDAREYAAEEKLAAKGRGRPNIFRLDLYLRAAEECGAEVAAGRDAAEAFADRFNATRENHGVARRLGLALDVDRGHWVSRLPDGRALLMPSVAWVAPEPTSAAELIDEEPEPGDDEPTSEPEEPEEEDLATEDYRRFHVQGGGLAVEVSAGDDWRPAVRAYMDRERFWPNVWFISDHGNAHLLNAYEGDA